MKILIMCGGKGRRLGKLGEKIPKPLVEVKGKTILEMKLEEYIKSGFEEFILCTGYKSEMIQNAIKKYEKKCQLEFSNAGENSGILKRLFEARNLFDENVIMTYGDTYTDLNLHDFYYFHTERDFNATIVVAPIKNPFGIVEYDHLDRVTFFKEKPILNYYIGQAVIQKSALDLVPKKVIEMPDGDGLVTFYRILSAMEKLGAYFHSGLQITFNTRNELEQAEETLNRFYTSPEKNEE